MAKVKEEYIGKITNAQAVMQRIQAELGQIALLENRKAFLLAEYASQEQLLNEVGAQIKEEYGDGTVDVGTGEFTPEETEAVESK